MQHFLATREQFHSNILGLSVQFGVPATDQRLLGLTAYMHGHTSGLAGAAGRAGEILGLQVKQQAFTLAINDTFLLIAWSTVLCLVVISCMAPVPKQYRQVVKGS
jgi:DHA2 family multidrug resistance protein